MVQLSSGIFQESFSVNSNCKLTQKNLVLPQVIARWAGTLMTLPSIFRQGYAVVVGVGADLPITVEDATGIANQLWHPSRCAYPAEQVQLLTGEQARRDDILAALDWLAGVTGAEDTAVIYFSGHGMETPDYYLMPYGYDLDNLSGTALLGKTFTEQLQTIRAQKLLVLLDCCHAGGLAEAKGLIKAPLPPAVIDQLGQSSGRVVLASSRKNEVSWTGNPYSVFTAALLEALSGYGAFEPDGYARVLDLALWVGRKVPERTQDKQHPIIKVSNLADNFALAWYAAGDKTPLPLPEWAGMPPVPRPELDPEQVRSWQRMLANYRSNLLLIEERMSEYIDMTEIPLQLIQNKRLTAARVVELEQKLEATA